MAEQASTRRAFLEALGNIAGVGAVGRAMSALGLATVGSAWPVTGARAALPGAGTRAVNPGPADWPARAGTGEEIVILGAGIAGMTAAWELGKLGYRCTLLEARESAGGRCRTVRSGDVLEETDSTRFCEFDPDPDLYFNPGPARIPHHHEFLLGYCREFEVALEPFINDNRAALLHSRSAFGGEPQPARRVLADTRGHIAALLATAVDQGALDRELSTADRNSLRAMLTQFGALDGQGRYRGSSRAGFPGQERVGSGRRGQTLPPLELGDLLDSGFWQSQLDFSQGLDQQPSLLQPVGGMDRIARAFESRVGEVIEYGAVVSRIRIGGGAVTVAFEQGGTDRQLRADFCICTIPATVLRGIDHNFSPAHRAEINGFRYTQACKIAFQSRRFWEQEQHIYGGISWTSQGITQLWYPSSGLGSRQGVIVGAYTFDDATGTRFAERTPEQRLAECRRQARRLHPQFPRAARHGISVAWPKVPFQRGAWGVSRPDALLQPDRRVYFGGEHLSDLQGWQEGAILSAYRAIDGIVARTA